MARAIERLDERVRPPAPAAYNAIFMQKAAVGGEQESATPFNTRELRFSKMVEAAGIEPEDESPVNTAYISKKRGKNLAIQGVARISWSRQKAESRRSGALIGH